MNSRDMVHKIADQTTPPDEVLELADKLFSGRGVYVNSGHPITNEMVQNILHALIKVVREERNTPL